MKTYFNTNPPLLATVTLSNTPYTLQVSKLVDGASRLVTVRDQANNILTTFGLIYNRPVTYNLPLPLTFNEENGVLYVEY